LSELSRNVNNYFCAPARNFYQAGASQGNKIFKKFIAGTLTSRQEELSGSAGFF
jgi:hypothetical protein